MGSSSLPVAAVVRDDDDDGEQRKGRRNNASFLFSFAFDSSRWW